MKSETRCRSPPETDHREPSATSTVSRVIGMRSAGRPRVVSSTWVVMGERFAGGAGGGAALSLPDMCAPRAPTRREDASPCALSSDLISTLSFSSRISVIFCCSPAVMPCSAYGLLGYRSLRAARISCAGLPEAQMMKMCPNFSSYFLRVRRQRTAASAPDDFSLLFMFFLTLLIDNE